MTPVGFLLHLVFRDCTALSFWLMLMLTRRGHYPTSNLSYLQSLEEASCSV
jgi:hypothetical protein